MFMAIVTACMVQMTNCEEFKSGPHDRATCDRRVTEMMKGVDLYFLYQAETIIGECVPTVGKRGHNA